MSGMDLDALADRVAQKLRDEAGAAVDELDAVLGGDVAEAGCRVAWRLHDGRLLLIEVGICMVTDEEARSLHAEVVDDV